MDISKETIARLQEVLKPIVEQTKKINALTYEEMIVENAGRCQKSKEIGSMGWVISSVTPNDINEWIKCVSTHDEESILTYFTEEQLDRLIDKLCLTYLNFPKNVFLKPLSRGNVRFYYLANG